MRKEKERRSMGENDENAETETDRKRTKQQGCAKKRPSIRRVSGGISVKNSRQAQLKVEQE